jgi:hypothetical protein
MPTTMSSRGKRGICSLAFVLACPVAAGLAQGKGTVVVVVRDATHGTPISGALVQIREAARLANTDSTGTAALIGLDAGIKTVSVRKLGYKPMSFTLAIEASDTADAAVQLVPTPASLPGVTVIDTATSPWLAEFEQRRRTKMGRYISDAELRASFGSPLENVLQARIPGIRTVKDLVGPGAHVVSTRGPQAIDPKRNACMVAVFVDGVRSPTGDINEVPMAWIGGVEFHTPGNIPVQYSVGNPGCGVLLLWTR